MEQIIEEVIFGALHYEMVVMLGPQYIIYPHETNVFLNEYSFFEHN